jgi:hypothetical protein
MIRPSASLTVRLAVLAATLPGGLGPGSPRCDEPMPSVDQIAGIEAEGRRIAQYFQALAAAQQAFEAEASPGATSDTRVIVTRRDGLHVLFALDPDRTMLNDKPKLVAEAVYEPRESRLKIFKHLPTPRAVPGVVGDHLLALKSSQVAASATEGASPPFDAALFFDKGQSFRVYLLAAPADGTVRFGGDFLVTVARNPIRVDSIEPLHDAIWPVPLPSGAAGDPTAHSHPHDDLPTATDVALVMLHPALAPHLVLTRRHLFRIEADGTIGYLGANEAAGPAAGAAE